MTPRSRSPLLDRIRKTERTEDCTRRDYPPYPDRPVRRYAPEPEWLRRSHEGNGLARDESGLAR